MDYATDPIVNRSSPSVGVFDRRAVLLLGMLLRDSEVAKAVRRYLLDAEDKVHEIVVAPNHPDAAPVALDSAAAFAAAMAQQSAVFARSIDTMTAAFTDAFNKVVELVDGKPTIGAKPVQVLPSVEDVAFELGVPLSRGGYPLKIGISRFGNPWARFKGGKVPDWAAKPGPGHHRRTAR